MEVEPSVTVMNAQMLLVPRPTEAPECTGGRGRAGDWLQIAGGMGAEAGWQGEQSPGFADGRGQTWKEARKAVPRWENRGREFPRVTWIVSNRGWMGAVGSGQDLSHFPPRRGLCHGQAWPVNS